MPDFSIKIGSTQPVFTYLCIRSDGTVPAIDTAELIVGEDMTFDMDVDTTNTSLVTHQFIASELTTSGTFPAYIQAVTSEGYPEVFPDRGVLTFEVCDLLPDEMLFSVTPSPTEVAQAHLMARTRDKHGNLLGRFTNDTSIQYNQAVGAIDDAVKEVMEGFGSVAEAGDADAIRKVIMLLAAANLEASYFPEQSAVTNSPYDRLMTRYNTGLEVLREDVGEEQVMSHIAYAFPPPAHYWSIVRW